MAAKPDTKEILQARAGSFENRFRALTASAPVGIYELTTNGELVYANPRCREIIGIELDRALGMGWMEAVHPDDRDQLVAEWSASERDDREFESEYRYVHPDGTVVWVVGRATRLRDDAGEAVGLLGTLTDISDRKRAEQDLALQAEVTRNMAEGAYVARASDQTIVFANARLEEIMGYGPGELDGQPISILHPADLDESEGPTEENVAQLDREGMMVCEGRNRRKDGSEIWCRATTSTFEHPEHGPAWVVVQQDITEERRVTEAAREAEERFRRAFEGSASGMALIEGDGENTGKFREVNRALVLMSGYTPTELSELHYWDLVHPDDAEAMRDGVIRMIDGTEPTMQTELRLIAKGDVAKWVAFNVSLIRDPSGAPTGAVVQAQDVTERKRFESELRYLADHDPLTGLYNRRRFATELEREIAAAARYGSGGALLILDLDNFKLVNDSQGHAAGDELLAGVAAAVTGRLRGSDIIARLGGDEFGIILPHANRDRSILVAESLREVVRTVATSHASGSPVSASVGIVAFGDGSQEHTVERAVGDADAAMYAAKEAGRDQVRVFSAGESRAALRGLS